MWIPQLFLIQLLLVFAERNPYEILGVPKSAQPQRVKKNFRALSRKFHPDRNKNDPEAGKKFADITWAYQVLTNDTLRSAYDRGGEEAVKATEAGYSTKSGNAGFPDGFPGAFPGGFPGGFPFQFFHQGPFGGGAGFGGHPRQIPIDWFENSTVDFVTLDSKFDVSSIGESWPDVFFIFREDTDHVERMAKVFVETAEILDVNFNFNAIDCRRQSQLCQSLSKHGSRRFEINLIYNKKDKADIRHSTISDLSNSALYNWISNRAPTISKVVFDVDMLAPILKKAISIKKPTIIIVPGVDEEIPMRIRQWSNEQNQRAIFVLCRSNVLGADIKKAARIKSSSWAAILISDTYLINSETVEGFSFDLETEFTTDLILTKWVSLMKRQSGIYAKSSSMAHELTRKVQETTGDCTATDNNWCLIYFGSRNTNMFRELRTIFSNRQLKNARLFNIENTGSPAIQAYARKFGLDHHGLIALKGKRKKYIKYQEGGLSEWVAGLDDSSILLRQGIALTKVPFL